MGSLESFVEIPGFSSSKRCWANWASDNIYQGIACGTNFNIGKIPKPMLFYHSQELFGMGPIAYLKFLRLNQVYKALKAAESNHCTVIDIATTYGFWSMNHFSRDYKRLFGELPSETLKKTNFAGTTNDLALSFE